MTTITLELCPGDIARLEEVARATNAPRLAEGLDPLTLEEVAACHLRDATLARFRELIATTTARAAG